MPKKTESRFLRELLRRYGVIGDPISHSLSPVLFNFLFEKKGMHARYDAYRVKPEGLSLFVQRIKSGEISGVNVTVPHKETIIPFIDSIPQENDVAIGAINTVVNRKGKLCGYNTDGLGFVESLEREARFKVPGKSVLIVGAGGAAKAIAYCLLGMGVGELFVYNRHRNRANELVSQLRRNFPKKIAQPINFLSPSMTRSMDLVIHATPIGLKKNDRPLMNRSHFSKGQVVYDLIYNPSVTALLKEAKGRGARAFNGLGMLARQAAIAYRFFFDTHESVAAEMITFLQKRLK